MRQSIKYDLCPKSYELPLSDTESLCRFSVKEYIKVTGILMPAKGLSVKTVSDSSGIDTATVCRCWNGYKTLGLDLFLENRHKGYRGMLLSEQICLLQAEHRSNVSTCSGFGSPADTGELRCILHRSRGG